MNLFCILLGIALILNSILFWVGIGIKFIKTLEELPKEEKINIKGLSRNLACIFGVVGIIFMLTGFSPIFKESLFLWSMVLWMIITGLDIYFIGKFDIYGRVR